MPPSFALPMSTTGFPAEKAKEVPKNQLMAWKMYMVDMVISQGLMGVCLAMMPLTPPKTKPERMQAVTARAMAGPAPILTLKALKHHAQTMAEHTIW